MPEELIFCLYELARRKTNFTISRFATIPRTYQGQLNEDLCTWYGQTENSANSIPSLCWDYNAETKGRIWGRFWFWFCLKMNDSFVNRPQ